MQFLLRWEEPGGTDFVFVLIKLRQTVEGSSSASKERTQSSGAKQNPKFLLGLATTQGAHLPLRFWLVIRSSHARQLVTA